MNAKLEETLEALLGVSVGFAKLTYESPDRFENTGFSMAPAWSFLRGTLQVSLEFQATSDPASVQGLHLLSKQKLYKGNSQEPTRWLYKFSMLRSEATDKILQSL